MEFYMKNADGSETLIMTFPLFKFLEKKWAGALISAGSVRLSSITEFKKDIYANQIHDASEGTFKIVNFYTRYQGYAKDAFGALGYGQPAELKVDFTNHTNTLTLRNDNTLIYCTTSTLFNESMIQAFEDQKDACVLIKDPAAFFNIISQQLPHLKYIGCQPCYYKGKEIYEVDPDVNSFSEMICNDPGKLILTKPENFINQDESRAAWELPNNVKLNKLDIEIESLKKLVINVDIFDVNKNLIKNKVNTQIGIEIRRRNKKAIDCAVQYPSFIPNPTILHIKEFPGRPFLGFLFNKEDFDNKFSGLYASESHYLKWGTPAGTVIFLNFLDDIENIRFYTVANNKEINPKYKVVFLGEMII